MEVMYEDGTGFYTKHNIIQRDVYQKILATTLEIIDNITFGEGVFVMCDYGTADGGSSMKLFGECIGLLKQKYGVEQPIQVVYEDQPTNDFRVLFKRVHGLLEDTTSYLSEYPAVYVSAVGTSFYKQCVPDNSVHFGFSSTAFHWLSANPCILTTGLIISDEVDKEERMLFAEQASRDWLTILLHRARELSPGGHMLINNSGANPQGQVSGWRNVCKTMNAIWRDMLTDNIITKNEFISTNLNSYDDRSEEELVAPFKDKESALYQTGLRLVSIHWILTENPFKAKWLEQSQQGISTNEHAVNETGMSAKEYATALVKYIQSWSYNSLMQGLTNDRDEQEKLEIVDEYYRRYEDLVAENPEEHDWEAVHACIHVKIVKMPTSLCPK